MEIHLMMFNFDLSQEIEQFLLLNQDCREFDIIRHLQDLKRLPEDVLRQPASMFRCHFLIFNALYRLQLLTHVHHQYRLDISSLRISMTEFITEEAGGDDQAIQLKHDNALSHFYLDMNHVMQTTEADVTRLLDQFWKSYFNDGQKQAALAVLGLSEPTDFTGIKKQYRRLAMKHHPDRGGDADQLIAVHQAMSCLEMYY
jgi:hypothetical protein